MLKKHWSRNCFSPTSWSPGPGLSKLENDTESAIYFFVYVFACLSKSNIWNSLQGIWNIIVLIYIGRDSEKHMLLGEGYMQVKAENLRLFIFFQAYAEACYT